MSSPPLATPTKATTLGRERWVSVRTRLSAPFERAVEALAVEPDVLLSAGDGRSTSRTRLELAVEGGGGAGVRQVVDVRIGTPCRAEGEAWIPISWHPAAHAHLLPSFSGVIDVVAAGDGAELAITGTYGIPLGVLGKLGDGVVGQRVARRSLRGVVEAMAQRLDAHAALDPYGWRPAPYPDDLRDEGRLT